MKKISNVTITPGCITCGACEFVAPEIFEVTDVARVRPCSIYRGLEQKIKEAEQACPVKVIRVQEE